MNTFDCLPDNSSVLLIDVQERFTSAIPSLESTGCVGKACHTLLAGAELLGVPVTISRQYPQGLGDTLPFLQEELTEFQSFDKVHFSCMDDSSIKKHLADLERDELIIAGVEAHVCVLATVADAIRHGYRVTVCSDAVDSRNPEHAAQAKQAMRDVGAFVVPVETVLFRWQRVAQGERFKALSKLVR